MLHNNVVIPRLSDKSAPRDDQERLMMIVHIVSSRNVRFISYSRRDIVSAVGIVKRDIRFPPHCYSRLE